MADLRFDNDTRDRTEVLVPLQQGSLLAIPAANRFGLTVLVLLLALCAVQVRRR